MKSIGKTCSHKLLAVLLISALALFGVISLSAAGNKTAFADTDYDVWDKSVASDFAGGDGSADTPYQIATGAQLAFLAQQVNANVAAYNAITVFYELTGDIYLNDLTDYANWGTTAPANPWTPIGNSSTVKFLANFDGKGFSVHGIYINNTTTSYQGLFGHASGTDTNTRNLIENIGIKDSLIRGKGYVGGLVGNATFTNISNAHNAGSVSATATSVLIEFSVGGIAGHASNALITNCSNSGSVSSGSRVGGIAGTITASIIKDSFNTSDIEIAGTTLAINVSGIAGAIATSGEFYNCYNTGKISVSTTSANGFAAGIAYSAAVTVKISNCYNTGEITATTISGQSCAAGIISNISVSGATSAVVDSCFNTGSVKAVITAPTAAKANFAGGIAGLLSGATARLTNSFNAGEIEGNATAGTNANITNNVGGIAASAPNSKITNCFNTGTIKGISSNALRPVSVGGIAGILGTTASSATVIENCYSIGALSASGADTINIGGIVGAEVVLPAGNGTTSATTVKNCYFLNSAAKGVATEMNPDGVADVVSFNEGGTLAKSVIIDGATATNVLDALNSWIDYQVGDDFIHFMKIENDYIFAVEVVFDLNGATGPQPAAQTATLSNPLTAPEGIWSFNGYSCSALWHTRTGEAGSYIYTAVTFSAEGKTITKNTTLYLIVHDMLHTVAAAATCTEDGNTEYWTCSVCNDHFSDAKGENEIPANSWIILASHDLLKTDAVAETCTTAGNSEYWTCNDCGKHFSDEDGENEITANSWIIPATGHDLSKTEAVAETCTTAGNSEYWTCSVCGKHFSDDAGENEIAADSWIIPAAGHTLIKHNAVAVTCTTAGNSEYWTCSVCGKHFSDDAGENEIAADSWIIPAAGTNHSLTKTDAVAETCTTAGNSAYWTCSICGAHFSDEHGTLIIDENSWIIPAHHTLTKTDAIAETCTTAGNSEYWTCNDCGKHFSDEDGENEIAADSWIIPAHHTLTKTDAIAETCTTAGNSEYWTCSVCGKHFSDDAGENEIAEDGWIIPAAGHNLSKTEAIAETCTTAGNSEYWTCSVCGKHFSDDAGENEITADSWIIPAAGHTLIKHNAVAATCTTAGNTAYWTCSVCGKHFSDEDGENEIAADSWVLPATGHSLTKVDAKAATKTEEGNIEYYKCTDCGKLFSDAEGKTEITAESTVIAKLKGCGGASIAELGAVFFVSAIALCAVALISRKRRAVKN